MKALMRNIFSRSLDYPYRPPLTNERTVTVKVVNDFDGIDTVTKRLANVANIPKTHLTETPPVPKSAKIELCARCNFSCSYCALSTRPKPSQSEMDFVLFKRIAKELTDAGVKEIGVFYIGESFLAPELLIKAIKYLKKVLKVPYVFLTSNASMAGMKIVQRLMQEGLDSLKWSCNFADLDQFKKISGMNNKEVFIQTKTNIRKAHEIRNEGQYKTRLYASSIRYDDQQEELMKDILEANVYPYVDEHYWLPLFNETAFAGKRTGARIGNIGNYYAPVDPLPCWTVFNAAHVTVDGKLTACCHDAVGYWVMGDLTKQSFKEAWYSEDYRALRKAHLAKDVTGTRCESCIDSTKQVGH